MRKTRLVILPTKCLNQMGFLLLFLSCPVIGDWGRIRPETENSHNAIQIDREGSCGMERDPPGGLLSFLEKDGSKQCRLSENHDSNSFIERVVSRNSDERRNDARRIDQQRLTRMSERRATDERTVRQSIQRRIDSSRQIRKGYQTGIRKNVRSMSVASIRLSTDGIQVRSSSLKRVESERGIREQRSVARNIRQENKKLFLNRRANERQNVERRLNKELPVERREDERLTRTVFERRDKERASRFVPKRREMIRFSQSSERVREEVRRESNRRSIQEAGSRRRENDTRKKQREPDRRLSLTRRELDREIRIERLENRQSARRGNTPETWKTRSLEFRKSKPEQRENEVGSRFYNRRFTEIKRSVSLPEKLPERNMREHRIEIEEKSRRVVTATVRRNLHHLSELKSKNLENEPFFGRITKWMDLKTYEDVKTEDWTTNCVVGAVVYFLTTRQIKTV